MRLYFGLALCVIGLAVGPVSFAGGEVGGGGGDIALAMQKDAQQAWTEIQGNTAMFPEIKDVRLGEVISTANVLEVDFSVYSEKDGITQESVAVNYPARKTILVNRSRWLQIKDATVRRALSLHEFLSLALIESTGQYPVSSRYLGVDGAVLEQVALFPCSESYEFELRFLALGKERSAEFRDSCSAEITNIAKRLVKAQHALDLPVGILKHRGIVQRYYNPDGNRIQSECVAKLYSFDPTVRYVNNGTDIKSHQGREGTQTACQGEFDEVSKRSNVVWVRYRTGFSLLQGFFCNVQYVEVVKRERD